MRQPSLVVVLLAAVAACSSRNGHVQATFLDAMVGQTRVETLGSDRFAIASYKDGTLRGAEVAHELRDNWVQNWIDRRTPVDHPQLAHWQGQLRRMQQAAAERGTDPEPLLRAASDFPFSQGRYDTIALWVGEESERAAQLLDRYALLDPGKAAAQQLVELALKQPQGDDRLARWIAAMAEENHRDAALMVAMAPQAGPDTATTTLRKISSFSSSSRKGLFEAVAPQVTNTVGGARVLVDAVEELSSSDEAPAILPLLRAPTADVELGLRVLAALGDFRTADRAELYAVCAPLLAADAAGADALVAAIGSLRSTDRLGAVRTALRAATSEHLVAGLLRTTGDLPSRDRARLVESVLLQPLWSPAVERAALQAVSEVSGRSDRDRLRDAVAEHARKMRDK